MTGISLPIPAIRLNVAIAVVAASSSGIDAATSEPKTSSRITAVSGRENFSARPKSCWTPSSTASFEAPVAGFRQPDRGMAVGDLADRGDGRAVVHRHLVVRPRHEEADEPGAAVLRHLGGAVEGRAQVR